MRQTEEMTFLDLLNLVSFCVGLQNLELNLTEEDINRQTAELDKHVNDELRKALEEIHGHLSAQDKKLNIIMRMIDRGNGYDG